MKTITIFTAIAMLFTAPQIKAQRMYMHTGTPSLSSKIERSLSVPDQLKSGATASARVRVLFSIDETGKAHVIEVNTDKPEIVNSVTAQFEQISFAGMQTDPDQQYSIWLNFKVM